MGSGKHRMSLKLIKGERNALFHFFGLVRDGAAWDESHREGASTDAWYMHNNGRLNGNGKYGDDDAGMIKNKHQAEDAQTQEDAIYPPQLFFKVRIYMHNPNGRLCGNGKFRRLVRNGDDYAGGSIKEGQIVSMEADLDKGTLRFWVDGKPHGPGHSSGVTGWLRWAVSVYRKGTAVQIVPTPELQPWTPWVPPVRDEDEDEDEDY